MPKSASPPGRIASSESASESARSESRWRYRNESSTCRKESDIAKAGVGELEGIQLLR